MSLTLSIQKIHPEARLPSQATAGSAGMDLCACLEHSITLQPGQRAVIPTGLAAALPSPDLVLLVFGRSGLGFREGLILSNGVGVIDADYRGEICVSLTHLGDAPYTIQPGDRVAQMVLMPILRPIIEECDALPETTRGTGGFGSTGR